MYIYIIYTGLAAYDGESRNWFICEV